MSIFLTVLSVIGWILAGIIGLILLLVLLILFVPVRYRVKALVTSDSFELKAKASWLFHILSVGYEMGKEDPVAFRIFGFLHKEKNEDALSPMNWDEEDDDTDDSNNVDEPLQVNSEQALPMEKTVTDSKKDNHSFKSKEKNSNNGSFYVKIKKYIEIVKTDTFSEAFSLSKRKIKRVIKGILPSSLKLRGEVGFDDPSVNGTIVAFISMLYPFPFFDIDVFTDFENEVLNIRGSFKGRVYLFKIVFAALALFFNKKVRATVKMFREV